MMFDVDAFEPHRPALFGVAYRLLGSAAEAEDMVQETFLRWQSATATVDSPRAYLTTIVTRLCLDQLKSARVQREEYVGPWLPEPVVTGPSAATMLGDAESISLAFLVLLESLSPTERAVYVLRTAFDYKHGEIAEILEVDEATCRQIFHRAEAHVKARRPRFASSQQAHLDLLTGFFGAVVSGDLPSLVRLLADDVHAATDSGGKVSAARRELHGSDAVSRFLCGLAKKDGAAHTQPEMVHANGWPALLLRRDGVPESLFLLETDGVLVYSVHMVRNPDKLAAFRL